MAFLHILRTIDDRCEQCDATEHVLNLIVSQGEEDTVRLTVCIVCLIVAMDNAMEWNMSRSFAQALDNRSAGAQVHEIQRKEREVLDERIREAKGRDDFSLSDSAERRQSGPVRTDSQPRTDTSAGVGESVSRGISTSGGKRKRSTKT